VIAAAMADPTSRRLDREIERDGPRAIYLQVAERLAAEIRQRMAPGDRLPPEPELAARFAINRHTLRHAIDLLTVQGMLERRRGLGTFVLDPPVAYPLHAQARFSDNITAAGRTGSGRLLGAACAPAPAEVAAALMLRGGNTVWRLTTLREIEGAPISLIDHWLPLAPFPALAAEYRGGSLHALLAERYGIRPQRRSTAVSAALPLAAVARELRMSPRHPVLRLRTLNIDAASGKPFEYAVSSIRADRLELLIDHDEAVHA
jgi:GntR family phosphonate transport system transcriptional regulator